MYKNSQLAIYLAFHGQSMNIFKLKTRKNNYILAQTIKSRKKKKLNLPKTIK